MHNLGIDVTVIRSLALETNIRTYGPFGVEDGTKFSFPITGAKPMIVGFHGKSGLYLNAIGVHVQTTQKYVCHISIYIYLFKHSLFATL